MKVHKELYDYNHKKKGKLKVNGEYSKNKVI